MSERDHVTREDWRRHTTSALWSIPVAPETRRTRLALWVLRRVYRDRWYVQIRKRIYVLRDPGGAS